jgi:dimethylhistidine N-methyltransferase
VALQAPIAEPEHDFSRDVFAGLRKVPRSLPCKYLYDARGSQLFSAICEQDEYYLTRVETEILRAHARDLAALIGPEARVIELGSGEARKTELLLSALIDPVAYVPVDICAPELERAAARIATRYPWIEVLPVNADYGRAFALPPTTEPARRSVVFFPGSTIGNFEPLAAQHFLSRMAKLAGSDGVVVVGVDLKKDPATLIAAYDDRAGLTAAFDKNLLARVNAECRADFALDGFRHRARWNPAFGRIEMQLESTRAQTVHVGGIAFNFAPGETITTEHCYKYSLDEFSSLAEFAGLEPIQSFVDREGRFSVHALRVPRRSR